MEDTLRELVSLWYDSENMRGQDLVDEIESILASQEKNYKHMNSNPFYPHPYDRFLVACLDDYGRITVMRTFSKKKDAERYAKSISSSRVPAVYKNRTY